MSNISPNNYHLFLKFYWEIIFDNKLLEIKNSFLGHPYFENNGYIFIKDQNYYFKNELIIDSIDPVFHISTIDRNTFLEIQLKEKKNELFENLAKSNLNKEAVKQILDQFDSIYKSAYDLNIEKEDSEILFKSLNQIIYNLKTFYLDIIEYHSLFKRISQLNHDDGFFGCKIQKGSFYSDLYDEVIRIDLIDDVTNSETDFLDIFTSAMPIATIKFQQPNSIIAYFIEKLEPFFHDFNPTQIEKSKAFENKKGKLLKASDIYNAKKRPIKNLSIWEKKIDSFINSLGMKYQI